MHAAAEVGEETGTVRMNQRDRDRESRIEKDVGRDTETNRRTRDYQTDIWRIRHNVARNPIMTVPNVPIASAPGKEFHPPNIEHASNAWRPG